MSDNPILKSFIIKAHKLAISHTFGIHTSKLLGDGYEFCEIREYQSGDDAKKIDWVQSTKASKPMVKAFHKSQDQNIVIVALMNGSLWFGTDEFKNELLTQLAINLSTIALYNNDSFSLYIANDKIEQITKQTKERKSIFSLAKKLYLYNCLNKSLNYNYIINTIAKIIKQKSVIILLGDFLNINDLNLSPLNRHDIKVGIIRDKFEENPLFNGNLSLLDNTSNNYIHAHISKIQTNNYANNIYKNDQLLYKQLNKFGISWAKFYTNEDTIKPLKELLK
ncbi:DUF58 domain-containing protein [Arcobacter sp. FWKO B]|uniref:DUF58 domain-containing protein n=1 Tax=Arcobacter sp. FWKO B TaxID=2593672 RepID=UPI001908048E|nr:DUF58 domain-containing protein [Arcobacter sp. FWKO B]